MKLLIILSAFICISAYAKDVKDLNKVLLQDVKADIQNDDEKFRKPQMRKPASVEEVNDQNITEPQKIDKNVRQIGPNAW
jgi:hypothetical protein